ncbi:unnamed protein product [Ilex paraguariensis]|uniref:Tetratricopeptide repeat protein 33 n=1 Tax=Ilex paraguariensis TaxID=185542 RepID=A0ABC8R1B7_9AQUA
MKLTWKNQSTNQNKKRPISQYSNLPFDRDEETHDTNTNENNVERHKIDDGAEPPEQFTQNGDVQRKTLASEKDETTQLAEDFQGQGNKLAEDGKYREALGKWEAALTLTPDRAVLHEQKAQLLLEIGEAWNALKAATRAAELEPSWAEAWITLGRAQLNFGEPDRAMESFDRALAIKPESVEAQDDRQTALHLVKRRKQLHSSGLSATKNRYEVGDKTESP